MRELQPGLWHWQAPHPEWQASEPWDPNGSSYAIDDGKILLLFDPMGVPENDTVLWVESQRAVISGDTLVDFGQGLEINGGWLRPGVMREEIAAGLRPLLECRSSTCSPRMGDRPTGPPSSVRSPE